MLHIQPGQLCGLGPILHTEKPRLRMSATCQRSHSSEQKQKVSGGWKPELFSAIK